MPVEKALFRKGEALFHLRRYRECCETFKTLCLHYPNNAEAKTQMTRALRRLAEQTHGKYNFQQLYAEVRHRAGPPHLDHATYIGPVAVRPCGSRGRGLFTTKAVKAGDLLFCEKAFTHAFVDDRGGEEEAHTATGELTILVESESRMVMGSQADLINMTIRKLYNNPSLLPVITDLHHGSYEPVAPPTTESDGPHPQPPVVDR